MKKRQENNKHTIDTAKKLTVSNQIPVPEPLNRKLTDEPPPKPPKPERLKVQTTAIKSVTFGNLEQVARPSRARMPNYRAPVLKHVPDTLFEKLYKRQATKPNMLLDVYIAKDRKIEALKIYCDKNLARYMMRKNTDAAEHIERFLQQVATHKNLLNKTNWAKDHNQYVNAYVILMKELDLALKAMAVNYNSAKKRPTSEAFGEWLVAYAETTFGTETRPADNSQGSGTTKRKI